MPEAFKVINCSDVMNIVGCEPEDLKRFDLFLYTKYEGAIYIIAAKSPMSEDLIRQWFLDRPLKQNDDICLLDSKKPKTESTVTAVYTEYSNVFNTSQTKVTYNHHQRHHRNHSFSHCPNTTIRKDRVVKRLKQKLQERRKYKEITEVELDSVKGCDTPDSNLGVELDNGHQQENNLNVGNDFGNDVLNDIDHSKRNKNKNSGTKENQPSLSIPGVDNKDKLSYNETASNSSDPHIEKCFWGSQNINQVFKNLPSQRSTSVGAENNYKRAKDHDEIKRKQNKTFRDKNEVLFEEEHYSIGCRKLQREDGKNVEVSRLIQQCRDLTNLPSSEIRRQITLVVYPAKQSKGSGKSGNRRGQANRAGTSRGAEGTPDLSIQVTDTSTESLRRPPGELDVTSTQPVGGSFTASTLPIRTIGSIAQEQDLISRNRGERRTSGQDLPVVPPRYPDYMNQPARQQSFRNWPSTTGQDASRMAGYGFFYKGQVDLVQCFQCGIGLKDWGPGDNPLFEHKRHSPQCIFLRDLLKKNQENLHMHDSQPGVNAPNSGDRTRNPQYETLQTRLDSFSNWPFTVRQTPQSLAEAGLFYTDDQQNFRIPNPDLPSVGNSRRTQREPLTITFFKTAIEENVALKKDLAKTSEEAEKQKRENVALKKDLAKTSEEAEKQKRENVALKKDLAKTSEEAEKQKRDRMCKICWHNDANIVFLPCGHVVSCDECAHRESHESAYAIEICPLCRQHIKARMKIYLG